MTNREISKQLSLMSKLMDLHGESSFKAKTYANAAFKVDRLDIRIENMTKEDLFSLQGIGESVGKAIIELITTGGIKAIEDLLQRTPSGILEIMNIKGLGPKKVAVIWKEMEIENIGELLYACHENRLLLYKGFGKATQTNVIEAINFYLERQGNYLYAQIEFLASQILATLKEILNTDIVYITGDFRRQEETIDTLEFVVGTDSKSVNNALAIKTQFVLYEEAKEYIQYKYDDIIKVKVFFAEKNNIAEKLFITTGSPIFIEAVKQYYPNTDVQAQYEEEIFEKLGLQYIEPCLRETAEILEVARQHSIPVLIQPSDVKSIIHAHSNWSDGANTIEELAKASINEGLEYLVISDHSKSAFYAGGLTEDRIKAQHQQVDELNSKYAPFKIFKSIESDILGDGSLDYSDNILSTFDLVIASVHSNLKMDESKAMMRLIKAIENPYTIILGHMTGRLLLSRNGYCVDYKKIIDACAANHVVIELNAHPKRLDMRWQWLHYALERNVLISIDPDAHSVSEFGNIKYGVFAAQKGIVTKENNLSSYSIDRFEKFLEDVKRKKGLLQYSRQ